MNRHRLIAALMFGIAAHTEIGFFAWMMGLTHTSGTTAESALNLITSPPGIIFALGAIWGFLLGHRICHRYVHETMGWIKSLGIGLAIPALASASLGLIGSSAGILEGHFNLWVILMPFAATLVISVFTLGSIYIVGGFTALLLHFTCKACDRTRTETRSPGAFSDNLS
ncbi:MAG: hypothetical protein ABW095_05860 [Candidatus Thiodiazotropha sp.]